jgi:hypothetical protein
LPFVVHGADHGVSHLGFRLAAATAAAFQPMPERLAQRHAA